MRTTVTLDPDVAEMIKELMRDRELTFKEAVNQAIRRGLGRRSGSGRHHTPTYAMGVPGVPLDKALQLAGQLEDEELVRRLVVRK